MMGGTYLEVEGCFGTALVVLLGGDMDFKIVDGFVMTLDECEWFFVFFGGVWKGEQGP